MADTMMGLDPNDALNDLNMSEDARPLYEHVRKFIAETVEPMSEKFFELGKNKTDIWSYAPGQLDVLEEAKDEAKKQGLWNFFLPDAETGEGLYNRHSVMIGGFNNVLGADLPDFRVLIGELEGVHIGTMDAGNVIAP